MSAPRDRPTEGDATALASATAKNVRGDIPGAIETRHGEGIRGGVWTELELFEALTREPEKTVGELSARIERCVRWQLGRAGEAEVLEVRDRVIEKLEALHRRGFSGDAKAFRVYLYRVVASQVVEVKREASRWLSLDAVIDLPSGARKVVRELAEEIVASGAGDALKMLDQRQEHEFVRIALARLDDRCRRLLWEREVERQPERAIADGFGLSVTNVGVSLHRCRERLYRLLLAARCATLDRRWERVVAHLGGRLSEPLRTIFELWWSERRSTRDIAGRVGRRETEVRDLLARAKAGVWRLAQETGAE